MKDPWKYPAFAVAGIAAFAIGDLGGPTIADLASLEIWIGEYIAAGVTGIIMGFLVDEMLPAYIKQIQQGGGSDMGGGDMDMDMDSGGGDDFDF